MSAIGAFVKTDATSRPVIVAIGGFDPTGGAGVVRDFLTARTLGAAVRLVPTAWTEQSPGGVRSIEPRGPSALGAAVRGALQSIKRDGSDPGRTEVCVAVKIGMLPDAPSAAVVGEALGDFGGPIVLDPVLTASSGGDLFVGEVAALVDLGRRVTLTTPNASEAAALAGLPVKNAADAAGAGAELHRRGLGAVLVKGGHLVGPDCVDILVSGAGVRPFPGRRVPGPSVRGTGCALATAIAVGLGRHLSLEQAIVAAKDWLADAIARAVDTGDEWHLPIDSRAGLRDEPSGSV